MSDLAWAHVVHDTDRTLYKRCRRAWDLGARSRQNLEPVVPSALFDLDRAMRDAMAVYYFPGMWEWDRSVVNPLAREAFLKSMRTQRADSESHPQLSAGEREAWETVVNTGVAVLDRYLEWAPTVDRFTPVRVETDYEIDIPDPDRDDQALTAPDGRSLRFRGRVEMLAVDEDDVYWLVDHRLAGRDWEDPELLVLDEVGVSACWAWERFFIGMRIAGVIYNEMRIEAVEGGGPSEGAGGPATPAAGRAGFGHRRMYARPAREPDPRITCIDADGFRRTRIPRSPEALDRMGRQVAVEALEMAGEAVPLYPHPTHANCISCAYRAPCLVMNEGADVEQLLETEYRRRGDEVEEGRLGGVTWSMNRGAAPPRFGGGRR